MKKLFDWILAITGISLLVGVATERQEPEPGLPEAEPIPALPAMREDTAVGQGQYWTVILLGLAGLGVFAILLIFILPPAVVAALLAFGPVVTLGGIVILLHLRSKGFQR